MDLRQSPEGEKLLSEVATFIESYIEPNQRTFAEQMAASGDPHFHPPVLEELKDKAKEQGLWNMFLPHLDPDEPGSKLSNVDYAYIAEKLGRNGFASEVFNCSAPDTGNMELLHLYGTDEQKERWLYPLLNGEIRSSFAMTEPAVASSDATNIETRIDSDNDDYVINGRKWFISGAESARCKLFILMGKTDVDASRHRQQSMILIPRSHPGVTLEASPTVFGYEDRGGHPQLLFSDVRIPKNEGLLGEEGGGFAMSQARLGPGRIHHCMRSLGVAELALELMCQRAVSRNTFGKPVIQQGLIQDWIAEARLGIDQARLMCLYTASLMDTVGNK
ncbi:MAG: acyl-CoA dehydrogenase family protein, partial [Acidimicrobiales bacterium]